MIAERNELTVKDERWTINYIHNKTITIGMTVYQAYLLVFSFDYVFIVQTTYNIETYKYARDNYELLFFAYGVTAE